jgi:1-phosphofructokinase family hexose kinase
MILTVTLNPLLERRISYKNIIYGSENRGGQLRVNAGGKGINVSRQLKNLNVDNIAITFVGGSSGKEFKDFIHHEGIKSVIVRTEEATREALILIDESGKSLTTGFSANSKISSVEAEEFRVKLEKMIPNYEIIILSGSSPCSETDSIFPAAIEWGIKNDKIVICDTYGDHLKDCFAAGPTIIHNNVDEILNSLNLQLQSDDDKISFLNSLYGKNIKQAYLTDGAKPFFASNFDYHFRVEIPAVSMVDPTGSGDAFVAGLAYGWQNDLIFEDTLKTATALGAANAGTFDICNLSPGDYESLKGSVIISPVGKRMKVIDVTPRLL